LARSGDVLRSRNLLSADAWVGHGPFEVSLPTATTRFRVRGEGVISGIREMYVRDCYLRGGKLAIQDGDVVVDLGANMGNFTNMALAHGPRVRVVSVEPSRAMNSRFEVSVAQNACFRNRATLVRALLGEIGDKQKALIAADENYRDAPMMSEAELIAMTGLERIDFLKCDIEGGEFALLGENSRLLDLTRSLAIEIHAFAGDVEAFVGNLGRKGLRVRSREDALDGSCILLASRD